MNRPGHNAEQPIIIVRRPRVDGGGHHGGAWKIAFADFMTAMMALFLVLWLVNAANEETKRAVASYFNPVKLVDRNRSTRGLQEEDGPREDVPDEGAKNEPAPQAAEEAQTRDGEPEAPRAAAPANRGDADRGVPETFDDPFASIFRAPPVPMSEPAEERAPEPEPEPELEPEPAPAEPDAGTRQIAADIERSLAREGLGELADALRVTAMPDGTAISIETDTARPMFQLGRAEETADLRTVLAAVASSLEGRPGTYAIEGHTDARPVRRTALDNWTLSTGRAHTARRLLARGGLLATLDTVSGHAAARPLGEPLDPRNRRITILFRPAS